MSGQSIAGQTSVDPTANRALLSPARRAIVEQLRSHREGLTAQELAARLGLHPTTARFHARKLMAAGVLATRTIDTGDVGRPAVAYLLAIPFRQPHDSPEAQQWLTSALTEAYAQSLDGTPPSPEDVGRDWCRHHLAATDQPIESTGDWLGTVGRVIDVLDDWGYSPEVSMSDGGRETNIELHSCPFLELAREHPEVICGVHRGLLVGALDTFGAPQASVELNPHHTPTTCHARIQLDHDFPTRRPS